jgi:hypothetical protein
MSVATEAADRLEQLTELITTELQQFRAATAPSRTAAAQRSERQQLETVFANSQRELDRFDEDIQATFQSAQAVAANSVVELHAGFVTNSPESVVEVQRLTSHLKDLLLAKARKQRQHEQLEIRIAPILAPHVEETTEAEEVMAV